MKELFPENYTVLLYGPPGVGKFEYCLDLTHYYLENGEKVIYLTTERSPKEIMERASSMDLDFAKYEDTSLVFVDCFSWSVGKRYEKGFSISDPTNLEEININMEKAVAKLAKPVKIVFHSLSPLFLHNPAPEITKAFQVLASHARTDYGFMLATLQEGVHHPQVVNTLMYLMDGYLQMKFESGKDGLERKMRAHHLKGLEHGQSWQEYEITEKGFELKELWEWI
ncbi:MAG: RAD55 family ATPase [Candidatus Hydrothermarchaeales archaeon]